MDVPPPRDYGRYLRSIYKTSLDARFATASAKDMETILSACEKAARDGKTALAVPIDTQAPQEKYCAHLCAQLHELNLDAQPVEKTNYRRVHVNWL